MLRLNEKKICIKKILNHAYVLLTHTWVHVFKKITFTADHWKKLEFY